MGKKLLASLGVLIGLTAGTGTLTAHHPACHPTHHHRVCVQPGGPDLPLQGR